MAVEKFSAIVGAEIRKFQRKMKEVDKEIREAATGAEVDIGATIKEFKKKIKEVQKDMKALKALSSDVEIDADIKDFEKNVKEVQLAIAAVDNLSPEIDVGVITREFQRKMNQIQRDVARLKLYSVDIGIDADVSRFKKTMKWLKARLLSLEKDSVWIKIKVKYDEWQRAMGKVASVMRNWGEIFSTQFTGALISLIPTLSPIISSLVGLLGSLGVMIGTVAGGTFALATAFGVAGAAAVAFTSVAIPTISKLFDESVKLTKEQQKAKNAFDSFKKTYDGLVKATEAPVLKAFTTAMNAANDVLKQLKPLFVTTAEAVSGLMTSLQQNINSKPIQDFFAFLNADGASILTTVTKALGNFVKGLLSMMTAFGPLSKDMANGFLGMSENFAKWADGLKKSGSFKAFVDYVRKNMPLIRSIFADAISGIISLFASFSDMGESFMQSLAEMMSSFKTWAKGLGENQQFQKFLDYIRESAPKVIDLIGNLTTFLVNFGIAMAPIGSKILDLVNNFTSWVNGMMETQGWFSTLVGYIPVVIGGFNMLMAPITGLITLFGGPLASAISFILPYFPKIANVVGRVASIVTNLASKALPWLVRGIGALGGPIGLAIGIIGSLIAIGISLYKNWDTIKAKAAELKEKIAYAFSIIKSVISEKMSQAKTILTTIWNTIKTFVTTIATTIWTTVKNKFQDIVDSVRNKMSDVLTKVTDKWNDVVSFLEDIDLIQVGKDIINGLITGITSKFSAVKNKIASLASNIPGWAKDMLGIHSPSKVMAKEVGRWVLPGISVGIESEEGSLIKSALNTVNQLKKSMATELTGVLGFNSSLAVDTNSSTSHTSHTMSKFKVEMPDESELDEQQPIEIYIDQNWTGEDVATYVDNRNGQKYNVKIFTEGG